MNFYVGMHPCACTAVHTCTCACTTHVCAAVHAHTHAHPEQGRVHFSTQQAPSCLSASAHSSPPLPWHPQNHRSDFCDYDWYCLCAQRHGPIECDSSCAWLSPLMHPRGRRCGLRQWLDIAVCFPPCDCTKLQTWLFVSR